VSNVKALEVEHKGCEEASRARVAGAQKNRADGMGRMPNAVSRTDGRGTQIEDLEIRG